MASTREATTMQGIALTSHAIGAGEGKDRVGQGDLIVLFLGTL